MAASLEERSSGCCLCNFRALPLFDFGEGTDDVSKSSSELESESSFCAFLFLFDERVSVVRTRGLLSWGVLAEEDPPLLFDFLLDERVSVSRTCGGFVYRRCTTTWRFVILIFTFDRRLYI